MSRTLLGMTQRGFEPHISLLLAAERSCAGNVPASSSGLIWIFWALAFVICRRRGRERVTPQTCANLPRMLPPNPSTSPSDWEAWLRPFVRSTLLTSTLAITPLFTGACASPGATPADDAATSPATRPAKSGPTSAPVKGPALAPTSPPVAVAPHEAGPSQPPTVAAPTPAELGPSVSILSMTEDRKGSIEMKPVGHFGAPTKGVVRRLSKSACRDGFAQQQQLGRGLGEHRCLIMAVETTTERGSSLKTVKGAAEVAAALSPIDSVQKAEWVVMAQTRKLFSGARTEATDEGYRVTFGLYISDCPMQRAEDTYAVDKRGGARSIGRELVGEKGPCAGRIVAGLSIPPINAAPTVASYLAEQATVESMAVHAFTLLGQELERYDAPEALRTGVDRARADEQRHAQVVGALARRYGYAWSPQAPVQYPVRSLEEIAEDCVVEGCVRETLGALLTKHQADTATEPRVARAMAALAEDELEHAALGWALAAWSIERLAPEARPALGALVQSSIQSFREAPAGADLSPEARSNLGLPPAEAWCAWCDHLEEAWRERGLA